MAIQGVLNVLVQADSSQFDTTMAKSGKTVSTFKAQVDQSSQGVSAALSNMGNLSGLGGIIGGFTGKITATLVGMGAVVKGVTSSMSASFMSSGAAATSMWAAILGPAAAAAGVLAAVAAVITGGAVALWVMAGRGAEAIKNLSLLARELGITTEQMASLERFGGGEGFFQFMTHLQRSVENVTPEVERAFQRMGLSVTQFQGPDQDWAANLRTIAEGYSRIASQSERVAAVRALGGRGGLAMMDDLSRGAAGIDAMTRRAERFGLTFTAANAAAVRAANREWAGFGMAMEGVSRQAAIMFAPLWEMMGKLGSAAGEWLVKAFKAAIPWIQVGADFLSKWGPLIMEVGNFLLNMVLGPIINIGRAIAWAFDASGIGAWFGTAERGWTGIKDVILRVLATTVVALGDLGRAWQIVIDTIKMRWLSFLFDMVNAMPAGLRDRLADVMPNLHPGRIAQQWLELERNLRPAVLNFSDEVEGRIALWNVLLAGGFRDAAADVRGAMRELGQIQARTGHETTLAGSERAFSMLYGTRGNQDYYQRIMAQQQRDGNEMLRDIRREFQQAPGIRRARL